MPYIKKGGKHIKITKKFNRLQLNFNIEIYEIPLE